MLHAKLHMSFKQSMKTFKESNSKIEELHRPHPKPETQWAAQASKERGDGEMRDVWLCHLNLLANPNGQSWEGEYVVIKQLRDRLTIKF